MKMPKRDERFEREAEKIIKDLDLMSYSRDNVRKIAEWVLYLSTQD